MKLSMKPVSLIVLIAGVFLLSGVSAVLIVLFRKRKCCRGRLHCNCIMAAEEKHIPLHAVSETEDNNFEK